MTDHSKVEVQWFTKNINFYRTFTIFEIHFIIFEMYKLPPISKKKKSLTCVSQHLTSHMFRRKSNHSVLFPKRIFLARTLAGDPQCMSSITSINISRFHICKR